MTQAQPVAKKATTKLLPEVLLALPGIEVVCDVRKKQLHWQAPEKRACHWDLPVALAVTQGLVRALGWARNGEVARIERSAGHATVVRLAPVEGADPLITVQNEGPFPGPLYAFDTHEAVRVAEAMLSGIRRLGGYR